jgi:hypothetical protein
LDTSTFSYTAGGHVKCASKDPLVTKALTQKLLVDKFKKDYNNLFLLSGGPCKIVVYSATKTTHITYEKDK